MTTRYPATVTAQETGGFCVQFVDLEEVFTEGDTLEEALFNASEMLTLTLEGRMKEGQPVPAPSAGLANAQVHYVAPDAKTQSALLLRYARGDRSFADLARALETSWPAAKRLEDASHWPSLKTLDRAARVLGKKLVLSFE